MGDDCESHGMVKNLRKPEKMGEEIGGKVMEVNWVRIVELRE